eukprot:scaffold971_cov107-Isochrysis_galbana.AAC.5
MSRSRRPAASAPLPRSVAARPIRQSNRAARQNRRPSRGARAQAARCWPRENRRRGDRHPTWKRARPPPRPPPSPARRRLARRPLCVRPRLAGHDGRTRRCARRPPPNSRPEAHSRQKGCFGGWEGVAVSEFMMRHCALHYAQACAGDAPIVL